MRLTKKNMRLAKKKKVKEQELEELVDDSGSTIKGDKPISVAKTGSKSTTDDFGNATKQAYGGHFGSYGLGGVFAAGSGGVAQEGYQRQIDNIAKQKMIELLETNVKEDFFTSRGMNTDVLGTRGMNTDVLSRSGSVIPDLKTIEEKSPLFYRAADYFASIQSKENIDPEEIAIVFNYVLQHYDFSGVSPEQRTQLKRLIG